jgi:hypothetical protein
MIGYKATDKNGECRGFKFEVGKTYTKNTPKEELECCTDKVFHFCRELFAIEKESNYKLSESRLFEVIAGDYVRNGDKYGTNSLTILREIEGEEKLSIINSGDRNSGNRNSGNWNSGDCNSGYWNSGDCNSGYWNSGNRNSGNRNSGNCNSGNRNSGNCNSGNWNSGNRNSGNRNSGNCNSGDRNSGNCNSGDRNSGNRNSGNRNSGDRNSGNRNSGDRNSGDWNSGDWNSGDCNSGYFNTDTPLVRIFNKDTDVKRDDINFPSFLYFDLTIWVSHDTATDEEKRLYKTEIETCGGFLKTLGYKEAFRLAWDKADIGEHKQLLALPNWNNEIFKEISGIDAEAEIAKESEVEK